MRQEHNVAVVKYPKEDVSRIRTWLRTTILESTVDSEGNSSLPEAVKELLFELYNTIS